MRFFKIIYLPVFAFRELFCCNFKQDKVLCKLILNLDLAMFLFISTITDTASANLLKLFDQFKSQFQVNIRSVSAALTLNKCFPTIWRITMTQNLNAFL